MTTQGGRRRCVAPRSGRIGHQHDGAWNDGNGDGCGATREGARALGLLSETGTLEAGKSADFAIWDVESLAELVYRIGFNPLHAHVFKGKRFNR